MKINRLQDDFGRLQDKLERMPFNVTRFGQRWVTRSSYYAAHHFRHNLETQGRGGAPPPLSDLTLELYNIRGNPDGSGIRNHIAVVIDRDGNTWTGTMGVPAGKPTMITRVQNDGATIPVTPAMRGWFAHQGIFLRESTTHFDIPGRRAWSTAQQESQKFAKKELANFYTTIM